MEVLKILSLLDCYLLNRSIDHYKISIIDKINKFFYRLEGKVGHWLILALPCIEILILFGRGSDLLN